MPGGSLLSFAVLTTGPNELMAQIHDRMPVVVPEEHFDRWLNSKEIDVSVLFGSCPAALMAMNPVSSRVNKAEKDGPEFLAPVLEMAQEIAQEKHKQARASHGRKDAPGQDSLF